MKEKTKPQPPILSKDKSPFFSKEGNSRNAEVETPVPFFNVAGIQPKLTTGSRGDRFEQQADRMAESVVNHQNQPSHESDSMHVAKKDEIHKQEEEEELHMQEEKEEVQMMEEEEEVQMQEEEEEVQMMEEEDDVQMQEAEEEEELHMQEDEEEVQMKQKDGKRVVNDHLSERIKNSAGKGSPLPSATRESMSDSFGVDFSDVNIHTGSEAVQMSKELGAHAFTHGNNVYFNQGKFNPETTNGKRLLAHELTHVVQQGHGQSAPPVQGFFKKIKKGLKKVGKAIKGGVKKVGSGLKKGFSAIGKGVKKVGSFIGKGAKKVGSWIGKGVKTIGRGLKKAWGGIKKAGKWVWNGLQWVGKKLWEKTKAIFHRVKRWVTSLPSRLKRLVVHLWEGVKSLKPWSLQWWKSLGKADTWKKFGLWLGELLIYGLEALGAGEILETLADFIKFNTRPMTSTELSEAKTIFGNSIDYSLVRIDEYSLIAHIGKKNVGAENMAVVTFHTVNFTRKIEAGRGTDDMAWLIHELTHVWQYERMGAVYMAKAIHAQNNGGYDYTGVTALEENATKGLSGFNLEQQGEVISDYYRLLHGLDPKWADGVDDISVYDPYVSEVRS
jgi:hypothetical protein